MNVEYGKKLPKYLISFNVCAFSAFYKELSHVKNNPGATVIISMARKVLPTLNCTQY